MNKPYRLLACTLAFTTFLSATAAAASGSVNMPKPDTYARVAISRSVSINGTYNQISAEKERELQELAREFNMSQNDIAELRELYLENSSQIIARIKLGPVLKVIKVCKPVLRKACIMFGVKMFEKDLVDLTDYIFRWQGKVEDGIKNFLIEKWGWNGTAADWTARTIMFVAF